MVFMHSLGRQIRVSAQGRRYVIGCAIVLNRAEGQQRVACDTQLPLADVDDCVAPLCVCTEPVTTSIIACTFAADVGDTNKVLTLTQTFAGAGGLQRSETVNVSAWGDVPDRAEGQQCVDVDTSNFHWRAQEIIAARRQRVPSRKPS